MEPNLFKYVWQHTRLQQLYVLGIVLISMPFLFLSLDLPRQIVNGPIQGAGFSAPGDTQTLLKITVPFSGSEQTPPVVLFEGFQFDRSATLLVLSLIFLTLVIINGLFKFYINTYKGRLGERMLRRLRYELVDRVLRFPLPHMRKVKSAEVASMVKDEVEPLGGFIGDAFVQPVFLAGQALTALAFIMIQSFWLGLIAVAIVALQAVLIPRLRRRLLVLGKQRQLTARALSGRVGEIVDGMGEVRANDASNFERSDIVARLGRIFFIRYELYQRKFFVKFINNFLSQVTPFLFFLAGGYFAIQGTLDIGQLVAVIAAYKDLPSPIRELINWDQIRQDVQIKYSQVAEQFAPGPLLDAASQTALVAAVPALAWPVKVERLSITDETGAKLLENASFSIERGEVIAALGELTAGADVTADALARFVPATGGSIRLGDDNLNDMPESVAGKRIAYVGPDSYLRSGSLMQALTYGLVRAPARAQGEPDLETHETLASGNPLYEPPGESWVSYDLAGVDGLPALTREVLDLLTMVELEDDVFKLGLRVVIDPDKSAAIAARMLEGRAALRTRLTVEGLDDLVEFFDANAYAEQASIERNLFFGLPRTGELTTAALLRDPSVEAVLNSEGLAGELFGIGRQMAMTASELFRDLPPDHPFFEQLTYMEPEELAAYDALLSRVDGLTVSEVASADREDLLTLGMRYCEPRHRLGLLNDDMRLMFVEARARIGATLSDALRQQIAFFDADAYNAGANLEDNILFGRVVYGIADAQRRITEQIRKVLDDLALRDVVAEAGLNYDVGPGGKRLSVSQRQRIGLARALLKRPELLIVNRGLSALSARSQQAIVSRTIARAKASAEVNPMAMFWVLASPAVVSIFDRVLVFRDGRIDEQGPPADLAEQDGEFKRLVG
ncbi:MAG: ABC transporter ATP-binding protein [Pseudomonadota bacterium]